MNSIEILPLASGVTVGAILAQLRPDLRKWAGPILVLLLAFLATVVSGEFRLSWGFLLVDIPMVAVPACATYVALRRIGHPVAESRSRLRAGKI